MRVFLIRLGGYLSLSLALALLAPAWFSPDLRPETQTREVVMLTALAAHDLALAPVCPGPPQELSRDQMAPYPGIILMTAGREAGKRAAIPAGEYQALAARLNQDPAHGFCLRLGERVYSLWAVGPDPAGQAYLRLVGLTPKGAAQVPLLSGEELARSPHLAAFVANLDRLAQRAWARDQRREQATRPPDGPPAGAGESPDVAKLERAMAEQRREIRSRADQVEAIQDRAGYGVFRGMTATNVPAREWRTALEQAGAKWDEDRLRAGWFLLKGEVRKHSEILPTPVPGMLLARVLAGGLLLALGLWAMKGLYARRPGFMVTPHWAALLGDALFVVAGGVGAYGLCELAFHAWLGVIPLLDEAVRSVMALMLLPCLAVFAAYNTNATTQSLVVTEEGVTRWGPAGGRYLPWERITGFSLRETHLLVGRLGMAVPRRLQTKLVIQTQQGEVTLFEPGLKTTKQSILNALEGLAPDRLVNEIAALRGKW